MHAVPLRGFWFNAFIKAARLKAVFQAVKRAALNISAAEED